MKFLKQRRKTEDELFRDSAPLSTFTARIALAFWVGLISKVDADAFDTLRKIRAHKIFEFDLTKSPHFDHFKRFLTLTTQDPSRATMMGVVACPRTDEECFIYCCLVHVFYLHETTVRVTQCPESSQWIYSSSPAGFQPATNEQIDWAQTVLAVDVL